MREHNETIENALRGRTIIDAYAPYGGSVGVQITLDDDTTVDFDPTTHWDSGSLEVSINGKVASN